MKYLGLDAEWANPHEEEGVLGLANDANTYVSTIVPGTVIGNSVFSLSYDPLGLDSIFTLGGIDSRYHDPSAET